MIILVIGDDMRTFYIFNIQDNFYTLYKDTPSSLYNILKQIHNLMPNDLAYATNIFYQVNNGIDKEKLDRRIFLELHQELPYKKDQDKHIYNNLYLNEETYMEIKHNYIKIKSNKDFSYFFRVLLNYDLNYFVCDFKNQDYFFLSSLKMLV